MNVIAEVQKLVPSLEDRGNPIRLWWDRLSSVPGGKVVFSRLVGSLAPYTGSIAATVVELGPGYAETRMEDRRRLRNHLSSVHAIALANLAELTGNIALSYGLPDDARFIVSGMSISYLKKARGTITGMCECPVPETSARSEFEIPVSLIDPSGDEVVRATLTSLVGPKRS